MSCLVNEANLEVNVFASSLTASKHKARELDVITLRNHAPRSYMT